MIFGISIERNLLFKEHFNAVKTNCRSRLNIIKTISKPHRSNNRSTRFRVAQAIVDSKVLYGLEITCLSRQNLLEILSLIFNGYVRTISGLLPSTPADAACAEAVSSHSAIECTQPSAARRLLTLQKQLETIGSLSLIKQIVSSVRLQLTASPSNHRRTDKKDLL